MRSCKLFPISLVLSVAGIANAQQSQPQQPSPTQQPSLISEPTRTVSATRGGNAQSFQIDSSLLKETRRILIIVPPSFSQSAPERRYPTMIVTDGDFLLAPVAAVSDELSRNGQIPEMVIVGIENFGASGSLSADDKRVYDLTPPGVSVSGSDRNQGGERFLDFIEKELLPAVDRKFRTATPRVLVGLSNGGILATYAAATRSTYSAVVSLDAPTQLGDNWLVKKMLASATTKSTAVRYASLEARFGWSDANWKSLAAAAPASWKLYRENLQLEGHESMQMLGAYLGLRQVFADYSRFSAPPYPTTSILPYYAKLSSSLGAPVFPPKRLLRIVVEDLLMEGRGAAAREAYNMLASGYGAPTDSAALLSEIAEVERRPPPTETVEGLLATPFPKPEAVRTFVGEWIGDIWMNPDEPRSGRQTLRINIVDGKVVGETIHHLPDGNDRVQRWEHLQITRDGITWGMMNGMRPRGVLLFEGKLKGDTISGSQRFGGVEVRQPDGSPPPIVHFSFKRVK